MKSLIVAFLVLAVAYLGEGTRRASSAQDTAVIAVSDKSKGVVVREEKGPAGHSTIGIDENSIERARKELQLTFSTLINWDYEIESNTPPPDDIKTLSGRKVRLTGFMYPLQEGKSIQYFCLLRTTQTCCYGPRPQYNQYVFVEMEKPTTFYRIDAVTCVGKFYVEPSPDEGFIYRMEGKTCESVRKK
jgi:hypothetical protein